MIDSKHRAYVNICEYAYDCLWNGYSIHRYYELLAEIEWYAQENYSGEYVVELTVHGGSYPDSEIFLDIELFFDSAEDEMMWILRYT